MSRLSEELEQYLLKDCEYQEITLNDLSDLIDQKMFGVLFILLALPSALPIPAPGYATPFGLVIFLLAAQYLIGFEHPKLPRKVSTYPLKIDKAQSFFKAGRPWLKRIEAFTHPRLSFICRGLIGRIFIGLTIMLLACCMMMFIPGTNTIPAIGVFLIGFGLFEEDGLITLAGLFIGTIGLAITVSIIVAAFVGGSSLLDLIKDWISQTV